MASTPQTSFSSDDSHHLRRGRSTKRREATPSQPQLPSPHSSDIDDHTLEHGAIEEAYRTIWNSFCGLPIQGGDPTFYLGDQLSYEQLYQRLAEHKGLLQHFESIRKSWNSDTDAVSGAIKQELDRIASIPGLRPFCRKIASGNSTRIRRKRKSSLSRAPDFEKSPDGQWHYDGVRHPPFILEVAYSEDGDHLADKVTQFFEKLPGKICSILGFDITYEKREPGDRSCHTASVSLWTSDRDNDDGLRVKRTMKNQMFRDDDGRALPGEVALPFHLFLPFSVRDQLPHQLGPDSQVRLTFACLAEFVHDAERRQRTIEGTASPSPGPQPQNFKRVTFEDDDGTVMRVTQIPKRQRTASTQQLGRTRSQTRAANQPRRSDRSSSRGNSRQA